MLSKSLSGLNSFSPEFICGSPTLPVPENMTLFGHRAFKEAIKLK